MDSINSSKTLLETDLVFMSYARNKSKNLARKSSGNFWFKLLHFQWNANAIIYYTHYLMCIISRVPKLPR